MPTLSEIYLKGAQGAGEVPSPVQPYQSNGLAEQYLKPPQAVSDTAPIESQSAYAARMVPTPANRVGEQPDTSVNRLFKAASNVPGNLGKSIASAYESGLEGIKSGIEDIRSNRPASGVGNIGLGVLGIAASPITGTVKEFVEKPVTELTGNPTIGEKAGFIAGLGLPVAKIGTVLNNARPSVRANKNLLDAIGSPEKLAEGLERLKANPRLSVADVFPEVLNDTQKLAVTEGKHQNKLFDFYENSKKTEKATVEAAYTDTMGKPVDVYNKLAEMKAKAQKTGREKINPVVKSAGPVDVSPVIQSIDAQLKPGITSVMSAGQPLASTETKRQLKEVRKFLTDDKSVRTNAAELHEIQSGLRVHADNLLNSAVGQDRNQGYALMNVRNQIVNAIDAASGPVNPQTKMGPYKTGLAAYKDDKDIQSAFDKGFAITKNRSGQWDDRPEFWREWIKNASVDEIKAAREGARIAVDEQINGKFRGAKKGEAIPEVEFNRDKLSLLFGKTEIDTMAKKLADERDIAYRNQKLYEGSQTAQRMKSSARVPDPNVKKEGGGVINSLALLAEIANTATTGVTGLGAGAVYSAKGLGFLKNKIENKLVRGQNIEYTKLVTATGEARNKLIAALENALPGPDQTIGQRLSNFASRLPVVRP